jgi:hypothetical protein
MALLPCPECKKDISDKAMACPQCGMPLAPSLERDRRGRRWLLGGGAVGLALLVGAGLFAAQRPTDYEKVEKLRTEQEELGTHNEEVQQRFFRLYKEHPKDAGYIYLWARCVDDAAKQLELAEEGMRADPRFSWNYNLAARDLARQHKIAEAYALAAKGADLDPANVPIATKRDELKLILDHKLDGQAKPAPDDKAAVRYEGLFRGAIRSPERSDLQAIERSRLPDYKGPVSEAVRGFTVCANHYADACIRAYVPDDGRLEPGWKRPGADVGALQDNRLVAVAGSVVTTGRGENILLADAVTVEAP